jgi:hypothetical protein
VADKIDLPDSVSTVFLSDLLPPSASAFYSCPSNVLRPVGPSLAPLHSAKVFGPRSEYIQLIRKMYRFGMVEFRSDPLVVNGVFAVKKDGDRLRLIIDAQPANDLCCDPSPVLLPNPGHLSRLCKRRPDTLFFGKLDLSNFYHQLRLPSWMVNLFGLPPLTPEELQAVGVSFATIQFGSFFPCCTSLPMGWSHSVLVAQLIHERVMYLGPDPPLQRDNNILCLTSPVIDRSLHFAYIDDLCFISPSETDLASEQSRMLRTDEQFNLKVKVSKTVLPTCQPVDLLGLQISGSILTASTDYWPSLILETVSLLHSQFVSGRQLAHLIGKWTWVLLLRRPALSLLQHSYRFVEIAGYRPFELWPSVRRELDSLLGILPLLYADLSDSWSLSLPASDASLAGAGVCASVIDQSFLSVGWRTFNQPVSTLASQEPYCPFQPIVAFLNSRDAKLPLNDALYWSRLVRSLRWSTIISKPWAFGETINRLECRAVLLATRWFLSYPSSVRTRLMLLLDSQVVGSALRKGRCASSLLPILRKVNALLLAAHVQLLPLWVPSDANPADAPSRSFGPPAVLAAPQ